MKNEFFLKALLLLSIAVTGCSKLEIAYDFAPGVIAGRMDDYFDLESKQKSKLKATIKTELDRIIVSQVPRYIELEKEWIALIEKKELKNQEVKNHNEVTRKWLFEVLASMEPALLPHALELSPKQIDHFHKKTHEELKEQSKKTESEKGQRKELKRRFEFGLNWNFGSLNSSEDKLFEKWVSVTQYPFAEESLSRKSSADLFKDASQTPETFRAHLKKLFKEPLSFRKKEYANKLDLVLNSFRDLQFTMLSQATEKDRKRRMEYTLDRIDQLTKLREKVLKSQMKK